MWAPRMILVAILAFGSSSCSTMHLIYEAEIKQQDRKGSYRYQEPVSTLGTSIGCGLSFWLYGGWCWAYLFLPTENDEQNVRRHARLALQKKLGRNVSVQTMGIRHHKWGGAPQRAELLWNEQEGP